MRSLMKKGQLPVKALQTIAHVKPTQTMAGVFQLAPCRVSALNAANMSGRYDAVRISDPMVPMM